MLRGEQVVQVSEHPVTDDTTANVTYVVDKLSREAFNGSRVRLLNAKNISIADVEGTRGMSQIACTRSRAWLCAHVCVYYYVCVCVCWLVVA